MAKSTAALISESKETSVTKDGPVVSTKNHKAITTLGLRQNLRNTLAIKYIAVGTVANIPGRIESVGDKRAIPSTRTEQNTS